MMAASLASLPSLLDPKAQGVPGPADEAGLSDRLQRHQRYVENRRTAHRADLDRADTLPLGERCNQRIGAFDLGLQLASLALRNADEDAAGGAELGFVDTPLPDRRRDDRLAVVEEPHRVECQIAP